MKKFIRIGLESEGGKVAARKLTRAGIFKFFAEVEPCPVGMEACGSALLSQTKGLGAHAHSDGF